MESKNKVYVQRTFDCDAEALFDWLTRPELIAQWFGPEGFNTKDVTCNAVEQGNYRFSLYKGVDYCFTVTGTYLEVDRPGFLKFSYRYEDLPSKPASVVSFKLKPLGKSTQLDMVQEFETEVMDFSTRSKAWTFMLHTLSELI